MLPYLRHAGRGVCPNVIVLHTAQVLIRGVALILVCERNAGSRTVVSDSLRLAGYNLCVVSAYEDLLSCSLDSPPDAIFIGTESADKNAVEIVSQVRKIHAHVPIIFACFDHCEAMEITWSDVPIAFLRKPMDSRAMVDLIARLVPGSMD
jgi:DNA-binding NtrC family response regulator